MTRNLILILVLCLFNCLIANAQPKYIQVSEMAFSEGGGNSISQIDAGGNAYFTFNNGTSINVRGQSFSNNHTVMAKLNAAGAVMWSRPLSLSRVSGSDQIYDLQIDKDQNVYVSGAGGNVILDDGTVLNAGTFLIKLDKNGKTLWGISPEATYNGSSQTGGPIAITDDGVFWSSIFYTKLSLQGRTLATNNPNGGSPDAFIAKVTANGQVTALYHDPGRSSIPQLMVPAGNGQAAVVMLRGDINRYKVLLDKNCTVVSEKPFTKYGDFPRPLRENADGYDMQTYVYDTNANGVYGVGFFDVRYNKQLDILTTTKLFQPYDPFVGGLMIYDGVLRPDGGYYFRSPENNSGNEVNWLDYTSGALTKLPSENKNVAGQDAFQRTFMKMVGDTLNMVLRYNAAYSRNFELNGLPYNLSGSLNAAFFWVKYLPEDPNPCQKLTASVLTNGVEGSKNAAIKIALPAGCAATEDITINARLLKPESNQNDFILPQSVILKKGLSEIVLPISIINDDYIENTETFTLNISTETNGGGYVVKAGTNLDFSIDDDDNTAANRTFTITYSPQITEGRAGNIKVSLPAGVKLSAPLNFSFVLDNITFSATPVTDYNPLLITIPAGTNQINFPINALTDQLIEGDEFISGTLSPIANDYGIFTTANDKIKITISDIDNTPETRIIEITPADDILAEGTSNSYQFKIASPYNIQYPLNINISQLQWASYLNQLPGSLTLNDQLKTANLQLTYPDDNVIRSNQNVKIGVMATDQHTGNYQFKWKSKLITQLDIALTDNDWANAGISITPANLKIKEGKSDQLNLKVNNNKVFDDDISINYLWDGTGINNDSRIALKSGTIVIPKGQGNISLPISIINDQVVNADNSRVINFLAVDINKQLVSITLNNKVSVDIVDDDITSLHIPNTFTPNGDGINDKWNIANLNYDGDCKVKIVNRNGEVVFQSTGYPNPWDGTFNGKNLPVGSYFYLIISHNITYTGSVSIIR